MESWNKASCVTGQATTTGRAGTERAVTGQAGELEQGKLDKEIWNREIWNMLSYTHTHTLPPPQVVSFLNSPK